MRFSAARASSQRSCAAVRVRTGGSNPLLWRAPAPRPAIPARLGDSRPASLESRLLYWARLGPTIHSAGNEVRESRKQRITTSDSIIQNMIQSPESTGKLSSNSEVECSGLPTMGLNALPGKASLKQIEQAVLLEVFSGSRNKEIASHLGIAESTVKSVVRRLFAWAGVCSRSQLVRFVYQGTSRICPRRG